MFDAGLRGLAFRVTSPRYRDLLKTAEMSKLHLGRFNTPSLGAVYASREPETAVDELRRRAERSGTSLSAMHPRSLFVLTLSLKTILNLTSSALEAWGLTAEDLVSNDFTRCQEVATAAAQDGAEAVSWPSATGTGRSLALYVEHLSPASVVEIERELILSRSMLVKLDKGADIRALLPALQDSPRLEF